MSQNFKQFAFKILFSLGLYTALKSPMANASQEDKLNPFSALPSIEILALSRGHGVPETTLITVEEIKKVANSALKTGAVTSVRQERIGLEGETRLCIIFRDAQATAAIGNQIRKLATDIELLQVNDNRCSGS